MVPLLQVLVVQAKPLGQSQSAEPGQPQEPARQVKQAPTLPRTQAQEQGLALQPLQRSISSQTQVQAPGLGLRARPPALSLAAGLAQQVVQVRPVQPARVWLPTLVRPLAPEPPAGQPLMSKLRARQPPELELLALRQSTGQPEAKLPLVLAVQVRQVGQLRLAA